MLSQLQSVEHCYIYLKLKKKMFIFTAYNAPWKVRGRQFLELCEYYCKKTTWLCKFLVCANDKRHGKAVLWVPAGECRTKIVPGGPAGLKNVGNIYTPRGCWDWILICNHIHTRTLYHQCRQFQGFFFIYPLAATIRFYLFFMIYLLAATIRFYLLFLFGKLKALQYNNRALNSNILITYLLFMM